MGDESGNGEGRGGLSAGTCCQGHVSREKPPPPLAPRLQRVAAAASLGAAGKRPLADPDDGKLAYSISLDGTTWRFADLKALMAKASAEKSGDALAGIAAEGAVERVAAKMALADVPLKDFLAAQLVPAEDDEVSALIAGAARHGRLRAGRLAHRRRIPRMAAQGGHATTSPPLAFGVTPEMVAAVSKIMRLQDLIAVAGEMPRRYPLPRHHRPPRPAVDAQPAEPPDRRLATASPSRRSTGWRSAPATR